MQCFARVVYVQQMSASHKKNTTMCGKAEDYLHGFTCLDNPCNTQNISSSHKPVPPLAKCPYTERLELNELVGVIYFK